VRAHAQEELERSQKRAEAVDKLKEYRRFALFLDLGQWCPTSTKDHGAMPGPDKQTDDQEAKPSRLDDSRRIIEEYAADLREIIKQLRRKLN
jgi:hypothetical protein